MAVILSDAKDLPLIPVSSHTPQTCSASQPQYFGHLPHRRAGSTLRITFLNPSVRRAWLPTQARPKVPLCRP
jgi:hypothetical protein